jgi:hypothetical protein
VPAVIALAVLVVLAGLFATARLTRLIAADRILLPLRAAAVSRFGPSSAIGYLLHCRWCLSLWLAPPVAAGVVWLLLLLVPGLTDALPWPARVLLGGLLALTYSHGTALLAGLEDED